MKPSDQKPTISDIAKGAGVSKTTVSRYLNGKFEYMSAKTRSRIETVINVAGYRPSNIARSLKSKKSMLVGVVVADIASPFSSAVIKGVGDALRRAGYSGIFVNSDNSLELEHEYIHSLMAQGVDGLLVNTVDNTNPFLIKLASQGLPLVLLDRFVNDYNFDIVYIECRESIDKAMAHLSEQGFGRQAFFIQSSYEKVSPRYLRLQAFMDRLAASGCAHPEQQVYVVDFHSPDSVKNEIQRLRGACKPGEVPAIIATNSVTLLHVLNAARALGLSMPGDIGICGFDDWGWSEQMGWASLIGPGVTAMTSNSQDVGAQAAGILLERIRTGTAPKQILAVPTRLIMRGSTKLRTDVL